MQDTISIKMQDGAVAQVPVVAAFGSGSQPAGWGPVDVTGEIEPHKCDHAGATWSSDLALRCPKCGIPLFVPGRFLAFRHALAVALMHDMWRAAGCPPWYGAGWGTNPQPWQRRGAADGEMDSWQIYQIAGFDELGGLPIMQSRKAAFLTRFGLAFGGKAIYPIYDARVDAQIGQEASDDLA